MTSTRLLPISYIKVGKRYRTDLGDLAALADSIRAVGLIQPVIVDGNHNLIAGERRLAAWIMAKPGQAIPAVIVSHLDDAAVRLRAERDENTCRKDMTASELYALGKQIEKMERPKAAQRQKLGQKPTLGSQEPKVLTGRVNEIVPAAVGMSIPQWKRLKHIGDAAANGDSHAQELLVAVDVGDTTITQAYKEARGPRPERTAVIGDTRTITKKRDSAFVLARIAHQLDEVGNILAGLDISQIKPAEAVSLTDDLSRFRTVLSRTINQLRSVT